MGAAACWSLLQPAIAESGVVPATIGLVLGGGVLFVLDKALPHLHPEFPDEGRTEGPAVRWRRAILLMIAITIHNVPEGAAVVVTAHGLLP